jgi:hypothetical protein
MATFTINGSDCQECKHTARNEIVDEITRVVDRCLNTKISDAYDTLFVDGSDWLAVVHKVEKRPYIHNYWIQKALERCGFECVDVENEKDKDGTDYFYISFNVFRAEDIFPKPKMPEKKEVPVAEVMAPEEPSIKTVSAPPPIKHKYCCIF